MVSWWAFLGGVLEWRGNGGMGGWGCCEMREVRERGRKGKERQGKDGGGLRVIDAVRSQLPRGGAEGSSWGARAVEEGGNGFGAGGEAAEGGGVDHRCRCRCRYRCLGPW